MLGGSGGVGDTDGKEKNGRTFKDSNHNKHADAVYLGGKTQVSGFSKFSEHPDGAVVWVEFCLPQMEQLY